MPAELLVLGSRGGVARAARRLRAAAGGRARRRVATHTAQIIPPGSLAVAASGRQRRVASHGTSRRRRPVTSRTPGSRTSSMAGHTRAQQGDGASRMTVRPYLPSHL